MPALAVGSLARSLARSLEGASRQAVRSLARVMQVNMDIGETKQHKQPVVGEHDDSTPGASELLDLKYRWL